jgi:hypothetical protein
MFRCLNRTLVQAIHIMVSLCLLAVASARAGDYAADFLRIGVGSRSMAMGGAFSAMANEPAMAYWNPAGMAMEQRMALQVEHVPLFSGLAQYNSANFIYSLTPDRAVGLSWIRLGVDDIPRYGALQGTRYDRLMQNKNRSTGVADGYFGDQENAVMVSFCQGYIFDLQVGNAFAPLVLPVQISFGVTGKYILHKLDRSSGTGQGLDAGMLARVIANDFISGEPTRWIGIGLSARNLSNTQITWNTSSNHKDQMARTVQAGLAGSWRLPSPVIRLTLAVDREWGDMNETYAGGEVRFFDKVAVRGGYTHDHMTAGAGLTLFGISLDYAFVGGELDNTHRISAAYGF